MRRSDGTVVQPSEWRTTKTLDLLRLLALEPQLTVSVTRIRTLLWPDSDDIHAGASLRTAASQLRKVLGPDAIERQSASLGLRDAWVDVQRYAGVLDELDRARRAGDDAGVVALARQADALYTGDVETDDTSGDWLEDVRKRWREQRVGALVDGAQAAARLRWMRDCADLAVLAADIDPHSEPATRALMRGLAGLGRTGEAVAAFERLRRVLADQFGVDPAPQTRALHLQLLRAGQSVRQPAPVKHPATPAMVAALARLRRSGSGGGVVWLSGPAGSGRASVVEAACSELEMSLRQLDMSRGPLPAPREAVEGIPSGRGSDVVVMPRTPWDPPGGLPEVLVSLAGTIVVIPVDPRDQHLTTAALPTPAETVEVTGLTRDELRWLARDVLQAEPSEALLERLCAQTGCLAGLAHELLTSWLDDASLVWTPEGMDVAVADPRGPQPACIAQALRRLPGLAADALAAVATADTVLTDEQVESVLTRLHPDRAGEVAAALDCLLDAGLLHATPSGLQLADRNARTQIVGWVRPSVQRRLQRLVGRHVAAATGVNARHLGLAPEELGGRVS